MGRLERRAVLVGIWYMEGVLLKVLKLYCDGSKIANALKVHYFKWIICVDVNCMCLMLNAQPKVKIP